ncbi:unnamed protein product [Penicillium camemberti]|uniref:Str. FM013 n=1 Tax=Penicillium camemberti (strain FM 013) TaxID=1429867 RepID=A0A0G4NSV8_PENC3|nr:unnamed protein product [Penicillium camemberti]
MAPKPWTPGAPPALEHLGTHQALYNPADLGAQAEGDVSRYIDSGNDVINLLSAKLV